MARPSSSSTVAAINSSSDTWNLVTVDEAVCRSVWDGSIPVKIVLDPKEVTAVDPPEPLYLMVRRLSLLPLLFPSVTAHFQHVLPPGNDTVWFDYKGLPLKWHIWFGSLFDLLCPEQQLPWTLTVHFRWYPSDALLPMDHPDTLQHTFMHAIKQSLSVLQGSVKAIMQLSQTDQSQLWNAVAAGDLDAYTCVLSLLHVPLFSPPPQQPIESSPLRPGFSAIRLSASQQASRQQLSQLSRFPVRILLRRGVVKPSSSSLAAIDDVAIHKTEREGAVTEVEAVVTEAEGVRSWRDVEMTMRVCASVGDDGAPVTLRCTLQTVIPELAGCFGHSESHSGVPLDLLAKGKSSVEQRTSDTACEVPKLPENGKPVQGGEEQHQQLPETKEFEDAAQNNVAEGVMGVVIVCQGVEISLDTPLVWLMCNMVAPDLFLHLCLLMA